MRHIYQYNGTMDAIRQIYRSDGILGFYRAYGATLVAFGPQTAINLALYEQLEGFFMKKLRSGRGGGGGGIGTGCSDDDLANRRLRERLKTRQRNGDSDENTNTNDGNTNGNTNDENTNNTNTNENTNTNDESVKQIVPPSITFGSSIISGTIACLVTTPLDLAKLRMQVVRAQRHHKIDKLTPEQLEKIPFRYAHVMDALIQIYRKEGIFHGLYKGAFARCLVWVPQTAIFLGTFKTIINRI